MNYGVSETFNIGIIIMYEMMMIDLIINLWKTKYNSVLNEL